MSDVTKLLETKGFSNINDKGKAIMVDFLDHCAKELSLDETVLEDFVFSGGTFDLEKYVRTKQDCIAHFLFTYADGAMNAYTEMEEDSVTSPTTSWGNIIFPWEEFKEQLKSCFIKCVDYGVKLNDTVHYTVDEFDGHYECEGVVTEIHADHIIVFTDGMNLWCDTFNDDMFSFEGITLRERNNTIEQKGQ